MSEESVTIYGTSDSNQITVESGADVELINFPGTNSVSIESDSEGFTVSRSGAVVTFEDEDGTVLRIPATQTAQLINFTDRASLTLSIYDGEVILDDQVVTTSAASINSPGDYDGEDQAAQESVTEICIMTFGIAPTYADLTYWANAVDSGSFTIEQVAQAFVDQDEIQAKSNSEFITAIYYNGFNRAPAEAALAYWVDALDNGWVGRDEVVMAIINGSVGEDAALLAKKTEIGILFAKSEIGTSYTNNDNFMYWAEEIITLANSDDFGIEEAEDYISELLSEVTYFYFVSFQENPSTY